MTLRIYLTLLFYFSMATGSILLVPPSLLMHPPPPPQKKKKKKCCRKRYLYLSSLCTLYHCCTLPHPSHTNDVIFCFQGWVLVLSKQNPLSHPFPPVFCTFWSAIKVAHLNSPFSPYNPYSLVCFYQVILSLFGKLSWIYSPPNIAGNEGFKIAHCGP